MTDDFPSIQQDFKNPVDIPALLSQLQIDQIGVSETRLLVIYRNAILNLETHTKTLETAQTLTIEIIDDPDRGSADLQQILSDFADLLMPE